MVDTVDLRQHEGPPFDRAAKRVACRHRTSLERFQEKWKPVFRPEARKNKEIERVRDSVKRGHALERFQEKWKPVFRPELHENNDIERLPESAEEGRARDVPAVDESRPNGPAPLGKPSRSYGSLAGPAGMWFEDGVRPRNPRITEPTPCNASS